VTCGHPARTATRPTRYTVYGPRRRRALLVAALALLLAPAAFAAAGQLLGGTDRIPGAPGQMPLASGHVLRGGTDRAQVSWPDRGQAAFVLGNGRPAASPHQQPAPIASLAKVMTAYLTLARYPLSGNEDGFKITVTEAEAQAASEGAARKESVVPVRPGEQLTERLARMNAEAGALGMEHTIYTDPSGFDPGTASTAADQLRVFRKAMSSSLFRQIVSMASVTLPVAGTVTNFNPLIAKGYAGKTGSDTAAGGCLAFFTRVDTHEGRRTAVGVVMGQGEGSDTAAILAAAGEAAEQLVGSATPGGEGRPVAAPGVPVGTPGGEGRP
jgi:serine-type D-Ala-D-Ala carboxypeptidase (penicillin-binding protein 5/6)